MRMIARYESGKTDRAGSVVRRIAEVFGVTTDYLLGLSDDPNSQMPIGDLTPKERAVISAMRRGELLEAIRAIVKEE